MTRRAQKTNNYGNPGVMSPSAAAAALLEKHKGEKAKKAILEVKEAPTNSEKVETKKTV